MAKRVTRFFIIDHLANTGPVIAEAFSITNGPPAAQGRMIRITEPGQINFNSFFISNELFLTLQLDNYTGMAHQYDVSLIIETEEQILFPQ